MKTHPSASHVSSFWRPNLDGPSIRAPVVASKIEPQQVHRRMSLYTCPIWGAESASVSASVAASAPVSAAESTPASGPASASTAPSGGASASGGAPASTLQTNPAGKELSIEIVQTA